MKDPVELRLDVHRNLLNRDGGLIIVEPILRDRFLNLVLKRLFFITSGALSSEADTEGKDGEGRGEIYRRAHYRTLTSTDKRPITMESLEAVEHAVEIKETYGIDIYKEIARRRKLGTLKPNQYITFVKESVPMIMRLLALPNQIRYDPSLSSIPI